MSNPINRPRTRIFAVAGALALGAVVLAAAWTLPDSPAQAAASKGAYAGKDAAEITTSLEALGYQVRKVEKEDGKLEAYAILDGRRYEIYVDPQTGNIVKIEQDD